MRVEGIGELSELESGENWRVGRIGELRIESWDNGEGICGQMCTKPPLRDLLLA